tara:strand:+ start:2432 stop:3406 length:975 start_codon:yes stop_codon:yes gene_type:complete
MIIIRSPQRISIGGGGTDLASYYSKFGGYLISAAIDKYVYVSVIKPFKSGIYLKYSEIEKVLSFNKIQHPIFREVLKKYGPSDNQIEITTLADIPSGTGLGSSGSFTTALIKGLYAAKQKHISQKELAEAACEIEIDILKEPIGKQDQYIASYGGIKTFEFLPDGNVTVKKLKVNKETIYDLEENLLLFFTGYTRNAGSVLLDQDKKTKVDNVEMIEKMHKVKDLGIKIKESLEAGDTIQFAKYMHEHWQNKRKRSSGISNNQIDKFYEIAIDNGAIGGKIVGAGGGGFLMLYAEDKKFLRKKLKEEGLNELRFQFDFEGTKQI